MDRIVVPTGENTSSTSRLHQSFDLEQDIRKRVTKSLVGYGGILVSIFLMFITVIAVTTDISISVSSIADLSAEFFFLFFCAYASYICCWDSGKKSGMMQKVYTDTVKKFNEIRQTIVDQKIHCILGDFCKQYIADDLKNAKTRYLVLAGIDYDEYIREYSSLENSQIDELSGLSTVQKKALKSANAVQPLKLYPEQITRHGGADIRRSPLLFSPEMRQRIDYVTKFFTSLCIVLGMGYIVLDEIEGTSWAMFAMICVKLGSVLFNCFSGYKSGYENVTIHEVAFMSDQISLMQQAMAFYAEREKDVESKHISSHEVGAGSGDSES